MAAGAPVVETAWRVMASLSFLSVGRGDGSGWRRRTAARRPGVGQLARRDGGAERLRRRRPPRTGRIERPEGRAGARKPDRAAEQRASSARLNGTRPGSTTAAAGARSFAAARTAARASRSRDAQPGPELLGEVRRGEPGRAAAGARAPSSQARKPSGVEIATRRRDEQEARASWPVASRSHGAASGARRDPRRAPGPPAGRTARPSRGPATAGAAPRLEVTPHASSARVSGGRGVR